MCGYSRLSSFQIIPNPPNARTRWCQAVEGCLMSPRVCVPSPRSVRKPPRHKRHQVRRVSHAAAVGRILGTASAVPTPWQRPSAACHLGIEAAVCRRPSGTGWSQPGHGCGYVGAWGTKRVPARQTAPKSAKDRASTYPGGGRNSAMTQLRPNAPLFIPQISHRASPGPLSEGRSRCASAVRVSALSSRLVAAPQRWRADQVAAD